MVEPRFVCADCGLPAPHVDGDQGSALITVKYGWRLTRRRDDKGQSFVEARCATCSARRRMANRA